MPASISPQRPPVIAVIGNAGLPQDDPRCVFAFELGRALVDAGYVIACGGRDGVMEAVCRGAHASASYRPGVTVGVLPSSTPTEANPWVDVPICTGLGLARNVICAHGEAVVAVGGGAGTLSEIALAWQFGRLVIGARLEGWSGKLADTRLDQRQRYPGMIDDRVFGVDAPDEVVALLRDRLAAYPGQPLYRPH